MMTADERYEGMLKDTQKYSMCFDDADFSRWVGDRRKRIAADERK
jgi:hypothetical protein